MKNILVLFLILISGCSSIPYKIEDIRVKETYKIKDNYGDGSLQGCDIYIRNIITTRLSDINLAVEDICGTLKCDTVSSYEGQYGCIEFSGIKEDYSFRRQYERGLTNND